MNELIEGMLSIGPWLSPDDRSSVVWDMGYTFADILPVRFHVTLWITSNDHN